MKPKISFDFDGTLEFREMQNFAQELKDRGYDICILTTRYSDPMNYDWAEKDPEHAKTLHDELYAIAKRLGITEINFTEYQFKTGFIDQLGIDIHIDDNFHDEVYVINAQNKARCVGYKRIEQVKEDVFKLIANYNSQSPTT